MISDLHIDFTIDRSNTISENTAGFVVYNAKESTRKEISREGNNIVFKYGYEDEAMGTLFIGNVYTAISHQEGPDWITTITTVAMQAVDKPPTPKYVSISYNAFTLLSQVL